MYHKRYARRKVRFNMGANLIQIICRTSHNPVVLVGGLLVCGTLAGGCSIQAPFVRDEVSSPVVEPATQENIVQSVFLIGDAGKPSVKQWEPTLAALADHASQLPERSLILFLGDNIYSHGMPEESADGRLEAERKIDEQVRVMEESGARGIFIPGNHDWGGGWEGLLRLEEFLHSKEKARVLLMPRGGCPGPEVIDIGNQLRVVILDTQWWLEDGPKPESLLSDCGPDSKEEVLDSLAKALLGAQDRHTLVAGHHPLDTHGRHGGFFEWKDHLFPLRAIKSWLWIPLPGLGSLYPLARNLGISNQDLSSSAYKDMRSSIERVLAEHPPLAYASGHEHALQVLHGAGAYLLIVSGGGTSDHSPALTVGSNTLFAHMHPGFVRIDFLSDGRVRLGAIVPIDEYGRSEEVFSMWVATDEPVLTQPSE